MLSGRAARRGTREGFVSRQEPSGKPGEDELVYWRGSVGDLLTDLVPLLTTAQLEELAGEAMLRWRRKKQDEHEQSEQSEQSEQNRSVRDG